MTLALYAPIVVFCWINVARLLTVALGLAPRNAVG